MVRSYVYLGFAIIFEVIGSTMLKLSEGFTVLLPSIFVVVGFLVSFYLLGLSLKTLPLSIAYAIWAGLGTALIALVGFLFFAEQFSSFKIFAIVLIISGVFMLNNSQASKKRRKVRTADI